MFRANVSTERHGWLIEYADSNNRVHRKRIPFGRVSEGGAIQSWFQSNNKDCRIISMESLAPQQKINTSEKFRCMVIV
jgi:hypothetical protein